MAKIDVPDHFGESHPIPPRVGLMTRLIRIETAIGAWDRHPGPSNGTLTDQLDRIDDRTKVIMDQNQRILSLLENAETRFVFAAPMSFGPFGAS